MKRAKRKYQLADTEVLLCGSTMYAHFKDLQPLFVAFDPLYAAPYDLEWKNLIKACEQQPTGRNVRKEIGVEVNSVKRAMADCRNTFIDARYFVKKAFSKSSAKQESFGLRRFNASRNSQSGLLLTMELLHSVALDHAVELAKVGFDADAIANIQTQYQLLKTAIADKGGTKNSQPTETEIRIDRYNALWDTMTQVSRASKLVAEITPAKRLFFKLPRPKRKKKDAV